MKCALCGRRKGRRRCPGKGALICSQCCGTKRRVVVACPEDCSYLVGSHAGGWEGRTTERERDHRRVGLYLGSLSEPQQQLFVVSLAGLTQIVATLREVDDKLVAEAVTALRKTAETRAKGVLYEHQATDARAQALVLELGKIFEQRDESGSVTRPPDGDLLAVLRAIEGALTATIAEGGGATAFLETASRLVGQVAQMAHEEEGQRSEPSRIILPG